MDSLQLDPVEVRSNGVGGAGESDQAQGGAQDDPYAVYTQVGQGSQGSALQISDDPYAAYTTGRVGGVGSSDVGYTYPAQMGGGASRRVRSAR